MPDLQWTHPWVLLACVLIPWLPRWLAGFASSKRLANVIHPGLLRYLLVRSHRTMGRNRLTSAHWMRLLALLSILILAGPTLPGQVPAGMFPSRPLVLALDLSLSMYAQDLAPSRLERARQEIQDVLKRSPDREIALMAWAGDAFRVVPFTQDHDTIRLMLPDLSPAIMPAPGSRPDRLMQRALEMLKPGQDADMLILGDGLNADHLDAFREALERWPGHVSWLLTATPEGAPVPIPGQGFLEQQGQLVIARSNSTALKALAGAHLLDWAWSRPDDVDLDALLHTSHQLNQDIDHLARQDVGHWLLIPLLLGWLALLPRLVMPGLVLVLVGISPAPAQALEWQALWLNRDQQAWQALQHGNPERAARLAQDPALRGTALYRAGRYQDAAKAFANDPSAIGQYNRGNALAQSGDLKGAREAWLKALALDPDLEPARRNLEWLERQERQSGSGGLQGQDSQQSPDGRQHPGKSGPAGDATQHRKRAGQHDSDSAAGQGGSRGNDAPRQNVAQQRASTPPSGAPGYPTPGKAGQASDADDQPDGNVPATPQAHAGDAGAGRDSTHPPSATHPLSASEEANGGASELSDEELRRWLRRIPDTPGGLLQRKFLQQYKERGQPPDQGEPIW